MTGIPPASLRNWEKRYGFPMPERTPSGHRFYCKNDVEFLKKASELIEHGHCLGELAEIYLCCKNSQSDLLNEKISKWQASDDVIYRGQLLYESLLKYDLIAIQTHYALLCAKLSPDQLFDQVFEVILRRLGNDWSHGLVSIAQEHYVSSFVRLKLAAFMAIDLPITQTHKILAATLSNEKHEGGLMLVAAHLKFRGYPVHYFGVNLPMGDFRSICHDLKPEVIALSYFDVGSLEKDLPELKEIGIPIIIGGLALLENEKVSQLKTKAPAKTYFCEKKVGSEAAQFVEYICQSK